MKGTAIRSLVIGPGFGLMLGAVPPVLAEDDRRWDTGFRFFRFLLMKDATTRQGCRRKDSWLQVVAISRP